MTRNELKQRVFEANLALKSHGLVIMTWGNVSMRDPESGEIAIKPSGVSYETMRPEDMVVLDAEGRVIEGGLRPSSDTPTHLVLYRSYAQIGGVVHTHSTYATAWAQAAVKLPCLGTTHADTFYGAVPCTRPLTYEEIHGNYEEETGNVIVETFQGKDPLHTPGVLVCAHGPFTWGKDAMDAVHNAVVLEEVARMACLTLQINQGAPGAGKPLMDKHFLRKHGPNAYYGQKG